MFQRYDMSKAYQEQLLRDASGGAPYNSRLLAKVGGLWGLLRAKTSHLKPGVRKWLEVALRPW